MTPIVPTLLLAMKAIMIVGIGLYVLFALILIRQEQSMADVLEEGFEPVLRVLVLGHAIAAVALLIFSFILL